MIAQFALRLICGMSLMWVAMPRRQVTSGFFRIQMLVVLGLSVLAGLTSGATDANESTASTEGWSSLLPYIALGGMAFCGSVVWTLGRRGAGNTFAFMIAGLSTAILIATASRIFGGQSTTWVQSALLAGISELGSSLQLGAAVTGMLLGHWYLTAPTMSTDPLNRLNTYLGGASIIRLVLSALTFMSAFNRVSGPTQETWLALRWLAGIFGPLLVSLMVWRILKYRNTQSATGVLFVGVILVFIGDMTGALLGRELGISL